MNKINFTTFTCSLLKSPGYRNPGFCLIVLMACVFSSQHIIAQSNTTIQFPPGARVWNVKDYGATGNGSTDDTQAIQNAITAALENDNRYDAIRIIYVPNGTYKISNTLFAKNLNRTDVWDGWRAGFFLQGESHNRTIIKLATNALGFWNPANPKAMIMTGSESITTSNSGNEAFRHYIRNMTIDVGQGNAGAIGIDFLVSNRGGIYDVTVKSSDNAGKRGFAGILMDRAWPGPGIIKDVTIDGFEYAMTLRNNHQQYGMVIEDLTLKDQRTYGIWVQRNTLTIRNLTSTNDVPAIFCGSSYSHLTVLDGQLSGGSSSVPAIMTKAATYLRNVNTSGYGFAVDDLSPNNRDELNSFVDEYVNRGSFREFADAIPGAIKLPVKETPGFHTNDFSKWQRVDGSDSDDLAAIQGAIDSSKEIVYLPVGEYRVSNTIVLRGNVKKLVGLCAGIKKTDDFPSGTPLLRFDGGSQEDVIIQFIRLFGDLELNSRKNLVIKNAGVTNKVYNTSNAKGEFYVEDAIIKKVHLDYPQNSWIRQLNSEFAGEEYFINNGGKAWMLGYKTEGKSGSLIFNKNGGVVRNVWRFFLC
ncbi:MAG: glycoside hydrolase family 55 protein [Cytophagales bacterium]|nr:glycoside hydrolase family 55 protein [Cytophagales bacterium]